MRRLIPPVAKTSPNRKTDLVKDVSKQPPSKIQCAQTCEAQQAQTENLAVWTDRYTPVCKQNSEHCLYAHADASPESDSTPSLHLASLEFQFFFRTFLIVAGYFLRSCRTERHIANAVCRLSCKPKYFREHGVAVNVRPYVSVEASLQQPIRTVGP